MFCPQCGTQLEEGKAFCKHCGARLSDYAPPAPPPLPGAPEHAPPPPTFPILPSAAAAQPPAAATRLEQSAAAPPVPPPPASTVPPPWQQAPPPAVPPQFPPQAPRFQPPGPAPASTIPYPPARGGAGRDDRPRWVVPFLAVMGVIIVGSALGLIVALASGNGDSPRATGTVATGTTLGVTTSVSGRPTETTATIPGYDPDSPSSTQGGGATAEDAYIAALDGLDYALSYGDSRIPELADEINATAPGVPAWVSRELQGLSDDILTARDELAAADPPARFQPADDLIFRATDEMLYRIDQTYQGIDAMWASGTVASGNSYFEEGRKARDAYRRLYDQYWAARP